MSAGAEAYGDIEFPLGDYRVLQLLGRGGIGEVFVAQRRGSSELCALKRLRSDVKSMEAAHARIRREAHLATFLDHPNICRLLDAGVEDGTFFMASEFVEGVDLERLIQALAQRRLALATDMMQAILLPTLAALGHAHRARDSRGKPLGIVHRDLSPRNIMVTFDGVVKVIDFGVAHAHVDDYRTAPGVLVGTLKFLSPEQALGTPVDARSDLYSIGAVMYEMLTGRSVVSTQKGLIEALQEIIGAEPRPVADFNPSVRPAVLAVLERALAKEREARFGDAEQMRAALRDAGGAPATPAALGKLVRNLFPEVSERMQLLRQRARESMTPLPRDASVVDPFSATAVAPSPEEFNLPTRAGAPDEAMMEDALTRVRTEIAVMENEGTAVLPTRVLDEPTLAAPPLPMSPDTVLAPPPSSTSSAIGPAPTNRALIGFAMFGLAAVVVALAVAIGVGGTPETVIDLSEAPTAPTAKATPSAAPRPGVTARATPGVTPRAPAPRPAKAATPRRSPKPSPAARRPAPARRPAKTTKDPQRRRLARMRRAVEQGEALDPGALTSLIDAIEARAAATGDGDAQRRVRQARDCLATCPNQERMLAKARTALEAVRAAESAN